MVSLIMTLASIVLIGKWLGYGVGTVLLCGFIVLVIALGTHVVHKEDEAMRNWAEYWSKGGPGRKEEE